MTSFLLLGIEYTTIVTLLFALVFTLGVIWRTEKKLDTTYKLLFVAILSFLGAKVLSLGYVFDQAYRGLVVGGLEFFAVFFLLLSILEMRDIVRILDHEVKNKKPH
jgi:hypothetical protein